ncbi:hypothetical protein DFJ58DRAFT_848018 [Suillus subalutaceus]|uniref:uncharacterized protein n=1 Tax=Suillus subalutaceus TaxID=48586 RepID=UPI001B87F204|nr:uncharacterized protein DFJ58DRAFT_848018 [Suillus subalutaceus]KAG1832353.1 hypothetical protein DFJ58DRAFT_848018 [Suillus subalutaceus]
MSLAIVALYFSCNMLFVIEALFEFQSSLTNGALGALLLPRRAQWLCGVKVGGESKHGDTGATTDNKFFIRSVEMSKRHLNAQAGVSRRSKRRKNSDSCFKARIFLDDEAEVSSGDGERDDETQNELFVVPDDDFGEHGNMGEHIVQSASPLMDTCRYQFQLLTNNSSNPSSASVWKDKVEHLFTRFNNPDSKSLDTAPDPRNHSIGDFVAPVTSGKWMVTVPAAKTSFLATCLSEFGLETQTHSTLPGRLYVTAPNSLLIRAAFPPSHTECFLRCEFIPGDQTQPTSMALPGWYRMTRGSYNRDAAYGLSYKDGILTLLVASRQLGDPKDVGNLKNERRLFKNPDGVQSCTYKGQKYVHGLLCIECRRTDVVTLSLPTAQDIALHMQSGCNPEFLAASIHAYSTQYWIEGDEVRVISGAMSGSWGLILDININDGTVLVDLAYVPGSNDTLVNIEDSVSFPIADLRRRIRAGQLVRVLDTSAEEPYYKGKSGIVVEAGDNMLVILDSVSKTEFTVSSHSVETYIVDQGLSTFFSSTSQKLVALPDDDDAPMRGDHIIVRKAGSLYMITGTVTNVNFASGQLTFLVRGTSDNCQTVPIRWTTSSRNPAALQLTSASGYDVVAGDLIKVVRGRHWNMTGTVLTVDLTSHTLTFRSGYSNITVPITCASRLNEGQKHDPMARFIGKQVVVIHGHWKSLRGTLRSLAHNTCQVDLFQGQRQRIQRSDVVSESGTLLDGGRLSDEQLQAFIQMLRRSYILKALRAGTPPPSPPPDPPAQLEPTTHPNASSASTHVSNTLEFDPWKINPVDREDMLKGEPDVPESSRNSSLSSILARRSLVLRVLPAPNGWYQNYHDRLVRTVVPDPFLLPSGPVEDGNIAVTYVSRSSNKGTKHDKIPFRYITAEPPTGKGKDFVLICGDGIGTIHTTKKAMRDTKKVTKDSNVITTMEVTSSVLSSPMVYETIVP